MGKDSLGNMMRAISEKAELSQMYSNHCVRVTIVSILHEKGFTADQISSVTGHKSTQSVTNYIRFRRDAEKRKLSVAINDMDDDVQPKAKEMNLEESTSLCVDAIVNNSTSTAEGKVINFNFNNCKVIINNS